MAHFLVTPYSYAFMSRALIEVMLLGALGGIVGVHVLLRRKAFFTEALQHTIFPGIAIAFVLGQSLLLGALVAAAVTVAMMIGLPRVRGLDEDSTLALLIASFFALGVVVVSRRSGYTTDLNTLLFGRILDVDRAQIVQTAIVGAIAVLIVVALHKELVLIAFDSEQARALGYRVAVFDVVLNVVIALVVVVAVRAVGTVLVIAFIVTPAAAARLIARSVGPTMTVAAALAMVLGWLGLSVSYEASVYHGVRLASGATIVLTFTVGFVIVWLFTFVVRRHAASQAGSVDASPSRPATAAAP
jgi:manganese/iron transport system permease protein